MDCEHLTKAPGLFDLMLIVTENNIIPLRSAPCRLSIGFRVQVIGPRAWGMGYGA